MSNVTVPCSACSARIGFGDDSCPGCGKTLTLALRLALEDRLEATSDEFRELRRNTRRARTVLVVLAIGHLAFGVLYYAVAHGADLAPTDESGARDLAMLVTYLVLGGCFTLAFFLSHRAPLLALTIALLAWLATHAVAVVVSPLLITNGVIVKAIVFFLLIRGLWSVREMRRLTAKLRRQQG